MKYEWLLDVLADLQSFADLNEMPDLAIHLDSAGLIAAAEIAAKDDKVLRPDFGDARTDRGHTVPVGRVNRA